MVPSRMFVGASGLDRSSLLHDKGAAYLHVTRAYSLYRVRLDLDNSFVAGLAVEHCNPVLDIGKILF